MTDLAPITDKVMRSTFVTDDMTGVRSQCWEATTTDGQWCFERIEAPGTPWACYHVATTTLVSMHGSLRKARAFVASGRAQAALERKLAEAS